MIVVARGAQVDHTEDGDTSVRGHGVDMRDDGGRAAVLGSPQ
jgi:hypothetical protein